MTASLLRFDDRVSPSRHRAHPLHGESAIWPEMNCALDLMIEVAHLVDRDPSPAAVAALSSGFQGDSWTTVKLEPQDLRSLLGLSVLEFTPWRPVLEHVVDHLAHGRLMTVEVDSWWLPDTAGTSYRTDHVKTSVTPLSVDMAEGRMRYLHNAGAFELSGEDFDAVMSSDIERTAVPLPYLELVTILPDVLPDEQTSSAGESLHDHLSRRTNDEPVMQMAEYLQRMLPSLAGDDALFHRLAFTTTRQFGAAAQLAAGFTHWWSTKQGRDLTLAHTSFLEAAEIAKRSQFRLARAARGRSVDMEEQLRPASDLWHRGLSILGQSAV